MKSTGILMSLLLLPLSYTPSLFADGTIEMKSVEKATASQPKTESISMVYTKNGLVRININDTSGGHSSYILFNSKTNKLIMVDKKKRRKMDMGEEAMDKRMDAMKGYQSQMSSMMEQSMQKMPQSQRRMMREKMNTAMMSAPPAQPIKDRPKPLIVESGKDQINNFDCIKYDAFQGNIKIAKACFASASELNLSNTDYKAIKAMFRHMRIMQQKAKAMAGPFADNDDGGSFMGDEANGIPIYSKSLKDGDENFITRVSNDTLSDKLFVEPDYPPMDMVPPGVSGEPK